MRGKGKTLKPAFHKIALTAERQTKHPKISAALTLSDFHMRRLLQGRNLKHWPQGHGAEPTPGSNTSLIQGTPAQALPPPCQQEEKFLTGLKWCWVLGERKQVGHGRMLYGHLFVVNYIMSFGIERNFYSHRKRG